MWMLEVTRQDEPMHTCAAKQKYTGIVLDPGEAQSKVHKSGVSE